MLVGSGGAIINVEVALDGSVGVVRVFEGEGGLIRVFEVEGL